MNTILLLAFVALSFSALIEEEYFAAFSQWKSAHIKTYNCPHLHEHRYQAFKKNLDFINAHDEKAKGFSVALNGYADLTGEEFVSMMNGMNVTRNPEKHFNVDKNVDAPASFDWRSRGAVTGVKNQGQCGSCWAFSTTGSTEGVHKISGKALVSLSEQNLVDCSTPEGNQGCNGGLMDQAFQYIISNHGIDTEASYPYQAQGPLNCRFKRAAVGATLMSYHDVKSGSEADLLTAVEKNPTSVAIDASHQSFQFYSGGIYYEPACSSTQLDHGVLAIGWGSGPDYWLVKNSWGTGWGIAGYIKMSRNRRNNCGIATAASYPIA